LIQSIKEESEDKFNIQDEACDEYLGLTNLIKNIQKPSEKM